jgi:chromosome segregation ATPase
MSNEAIRLQNIKSQIERGRTEKARAEATLETLAKQEADIHVQLRELGVAPENLESEIESLKAQIAEQLSKAEELLAPPAPANQGA